MNKSKQPWLPALSAKNAALSFQHLFAMFGATVLVPLLTGLNVSTALLTAGLGTLLFHLLTKNKVPVFLGSSFAFIPGISAVVASQGYQYAQGGIIIAGLLYLIFSLIVYFVGVDRIRKLFPPIVTGPVIVVIGLMLSYSAINNAFGFSTPSGGQLSFNWLNCVIALFTIVIVVIMTVRARGFFKLVPILIGILAGYLLCVILHFCGVFTMDFSGITNAQWFNIPFSEATANANGATFCSLPKFSWSAILIIAPVALVTFMEHIGDITASSAVCKQDFTRDPGLHRTLMGDGLATALAGFLGGPANTTYSENTGVLATTKNYNPGLLRWTAIFAIVLSFIGKFGGFLNTIPGPVMGGVSVVLYGMIAAVGVRTMIEGKVDFSKSRNLLIFGIITVVGIGITIATYIPGLLSVGGVPLGSTFSLSGLFIAVILGVILNAVLPDKEKDLNGDDSEAEKTTEEK